MLNFMFIMETCHRITEIHNQHSSSWSASFPLTFCLIFLSPSAITSHFNVVLRVSNLCFLAFCIFHSSPPLFSLLSRGTQFWQTVSVFILIDVTTNCPTNPTAYKILAVRLILILDEQVSPWEQGNYQQQNHFRVSWESENMTVNSLHQRHFYSATSFSAPGKWYTPNTTLIRGPISSPLGNRSYSRLILLSDCDFEHLESSFKGNLEAEISNLNWGGISWQ